MSGEPDPPDLWATTPADRPEGDAIRLQREARRAEVDATDARRQALMEQARAAGWQAYLIGPGEYRFQRWGQVHDMIGDDEATAFVQRVVGAVA